MEQELEALIRRADLAHSDAADKLFAILYRELHQIAERNLHSAGSSFSLGTTTLLHEAYLNLTGREAVPSLDRSRFLAYASRAMRDRLRALLAEDSCDLVHVHLIRMAQYCRFDRSRVHGEHGLGRAIRA